MPLTSDENKYLTLINVFTVDPLNQQQLVDLLSLATETGIRKMPGFISWVFIAALMERKWLYMSNGKILKTIKK